MYTENMETYAMITNNLVVGIAILAAVSLVMLYWRYMN